MIVQVQQPKAQRGGRGKMPAWPGLEKRDPRVGSGSCSGVDVQPAPHATLASGLVTSRAPPAGRKRRAWEPSSAPAQHPLGRLRQMAY